MIDFVTLFVGLVIGVQEVEVAVSGPVARVELRLDGELLAELEGPPWRTRCDLGRELRPARLEAVAIDEGGREIGRAGRWLNLPGERAEAEIVAIRDDRGWVTAARLAWSSPELGPPKRILVELDGRRLEPDPEGLVDLSGAAPGAIHVLSAELHFSSDVVARRELVFGREFEGETDSGLTAVVVVLEGLDELPPPGEMAGWFVDDGVELEVVAVERPEARLVVVRDPSVVSRLEDLAPEVERRLKAARRRGEPPPDAFAADTGIFILSPEPAAPGGRPTPAVLFPFSNRPAPGPDGLVEAAVGSAPASLLGGPLMMADGVAVAGLRAAESNGRRAVVLLLGPEREDGSRFDPSVALGYLRSLRVPLHVWDLSGPAAAPPDGWGRVSPVDTVDDLERAVRRTRALLDAQRVVWLRGRRLPQAITLSPRAEGIRLAE